MTIIYSLNKALFSSISYLPFHSLYILSDVVGFIARYIVRYRLKTVRDNLRRAFPEKTPEEIQRLTNKYYRNLADITMETIKLISIKPGEISQRFRFSNLDLLESSFSKGRSVIVSIGHCGNWEWMNIALGLTASRKGYALVKPLSSSAFNQLMQETRQRMNPGSTIPFRHAYRAMLRNSKASNAFYLIAADQTPARDEINYWTRFLNQDTPFFMGIGKLARNLDFDVVYVDIRRIRRGHYQGDIRLITDDPAGSDETAIIGNYIRMLETSIRENPDNWLWSHRRWKYNGTYPGN